MPEATEEKTRTLVVSVPEELFIEFKVLCVLAGKSMTAKVVELLRNAVEQDKER